MTGSRQLMSEAWLRLYAVASRFYPAAAVVLLTTLSARAGEHAVVAVLGLIVGSSILPQIFDLGMARRITMEAALLDDEETRDRTVALLGVQYLWFSLVMALPAIAYVSWSQTTLATEVVPVLPFAVLLSCMTAPISVLVSAALYGWRRCSLLQMVFTAVVDMLLLVLLAWLALQRPLWTPIGLAVALLFRQMLLCRVFGIVGIVTAALVAPWRAWRELLGTARCHGSAELRLGLYSIAAWGLDPFLYVHIKAPADVATHLIATRVAQAAISVLNVLLIASLWRSQGASGVISRNVLTPKVSGMIVYVGGGLLVTFLGRELWGWSTLAGPWLVVTAVVAGTLIAMVRQNLCIAFMRAHRDVREGSSYLDMALVLTLKALAVQTADVVLLEFASIVASGLFLWRLSRAPTVLPLST